MQPAVAFANVGELSIDLLVCTLKAELVARVDSENVLACVGNNAYQLQPPGVLATAMELYHVPGGVGTLAKGSRASCTHCHVISQHTSNSNTSFFLSLTPGLVGVWGRLAWVCA